MLVIIKIKGIRPVFARRRLLFEEFAVSDVQLNSSSKNQLNELEKFEASLDAAAQ